MKYPAVPVIMYHSIGIPNSEWIWDHLILPWQLFEDHLRWLKRMGFRSISLQELHEYKKSGYMPHDKPVVLTFDDGYLDNWVFAYPLLKRYGFEGVIFVNPEFVDKKDIVRKNLLDVWKGRVSYDGLDTRGFLSWKEMKAMEREGVVDIQSHSMTHTWFFNGNEIIDFHHPGNNRYPWMSWNEAPHKKYLYLNEEQEGLFPHGRPIYRHGRALEIRRYFEDKALTETLVDYVRTKGAHFFENPNWRKLLFDQIRLYKLHNGTNDRYETDGEQRLRFEDELRQSKNILEEKLNKRIEFFCWPGGSKTKQGIELCNEIGYKAHTCSIYVEGGKNVFSEDPSKISRIASTCIHYGGKVYYLGGMGLTVDLFAFRGSQFARIIRKMIKLFYLVLIKIGIKR